MNNKYWEEEIETMSRENKLIKHPKKKPPNKKKILVTIKTNNESFHVPIFQTTTTQKNDKDCG